MRGRKLQPKNHGVATLQGTAVSGNLINFNLPGITETENKLIYNLRTQSKNVGNFSPVIDRTIINIWWI